MGRSRIRVVVAAASSITANQLARDLAADPLLTVQTATTAAKLFDAITLARPAVILLDTHFVGQSTPQLTEGLSRQRQIPVVLRADQSDAATLLLDTLDAGALAISTRPSTPGQTAELNPGLIWTLRSAAEASGAKLGESPRFEKLKPSTNTTSLLAFGGGIGSLPALQTILMQLPAGAPGGVAIAPLPSYLTNAWASRISARCEIRVKTASSGDAIVPGQMLIAAGDAHTMLRRSPAGLAVVVKDGPAVFHQKPSIEVLFNSLVEHAGQSTVAAYLSGSGDDGVTGLLALRNAGARTIIQSPETCLCPEAPERAVRCRAGEFSTPLGEIARQMLELSTQVQLPRAA